MKDSVQFPSFLEIEKELIEIKKEVEEKRKNLLQKYYKQLGIGVSVVVLIMFLIALISSAASVGNSLLFITFAFMISLFLAFIFYIKIKKEYQKHFKKIIVKIIEVLVKNTNEQVLTKEEIKNAVNFVNYNETSSIARRAFINSEITPTTLDFNDKITSEDEFESKIGKVNFNFSEIRAYKITKDNSGKKSKRSVFEGVFLIADFNKQLEGVTKVYDRNVWIKNGEVKKFHSKMIEFVTNLISYGSLVFVVVSFIYKLMNSFSIETMSEFISSSFYMIIFIAMIFLLKKKYKKIELENDEFNNIYQTYSTSQIESRYILSSTIMERMVELRKKIKRPINYVFKGDHVFMGIKYRGINLFEGNLFKQVTSEQLQDDYEVFKEILDIIIRLELNIRIWDKK